MITNTIRDWSCSSAHEGDIDDIQRMINENVDIYRGKLEAYEKANNSFWINTADPTKVDPVIRDVLAEGRENAKDYIGIYENAQAMLDRKRDSKEHDKSILFLEICWEYRKVAGIHAYDVSKAISELVAGFEYDQVFSGVLTDEEIPIFDEEEDYAISHVYLFCKDNREAVAVKLAI